MSLDMAAACPNSGAIIMPQDVSANKTSLFWFALQVRGRHEKAVSELLRRKGFDEFLPFYLARRQWSRRVANIELPLFPGYVFCRFDPKERRVPIMTTPGVMGIVGFGGKPTPVDSNEIEDIHRVLATGIATEPWQWIPSGQSVRVEHGPLTGIEGIFIKAKKNHRLLLSVTLLQRSVAIQIDSSCVVPLGESRGVSARLPAFTV